MKRWLIDLLQCPRCAPCAALRITATEETVQEILTGTLECPNCAAQFPIQGGIPRFVTPERNYSENFGIQWRSFRTTQIDRLAGHDLTERRFFKDTQWPAEWLNGKLILDAGGGAGRFSDVMAQHGARVVMIDMSSAVEACRTTENDPRGRSAMRGEIEVVQGDLLALPFKDGVFDAVHCAGVIQHTPDPAAVMSNLPAMVRNGGRVFYNFYEIDPTSKFQFIKYLLRRITPDWPPERLFRFSRWLCRIFFVPSLIISRIPKVRFFNRFLPICSVHPPELSVRLQYEMTLLDTIDWYGPKYEIRQDHRRAARLLSDLNLTEVHSAPGLVWAIMARPADIGSSTTR